MTKPIVYDHIPVELRNSPKKYVAILIQDVVVETSNKAIDKTIQRGIYTFMLRKDRDAFTTHCNDELNKTVALRYNIKPKGKN